MCPPDEEELAIQMCEYLTQVIQSQAGKPPSGAAPWIEEYFDDDFE